ncbi:MAG TPA: hypothetical protein PLU67_06735, partial [Candidatus Kapabacteria bacterium]|nr:hypothetical protein [Candidatus Kapabacteria bacterium]
LNILVNSPQNYSNLQVKIINSFGQQIFEKAAYVNKDGIVLIEIDAQSLNVGVYVISITDGYSIFDSKLFIVKR